MINREELVKYIRGQLEPTDNIKDVPKYICLRNKGGQFHYGLQELRELLDLIYEGKPITDKEMLLR